VKALVPLAMLAPLAFAADAGTAVPRIEVVNEARVPAAELDSILKDFRDWAGRVYAYHGGREPQPVTLELTRRVPFGFYRAGTVTLPPDADRWTMLDDWVHELTHHVTGHDSSFFFKEGVAVHTLEELFGREGRVPQTWPQFGQPTDAWAALFLERRRLLPLAEALAWPRYRGDTPEHDFRSWQIYLAGGSFVGWYIRRHGLAALHAAFARRAFAQDLASLEREWHAFLAARHHAPFDPATVLPARPRYRNYAGRLRP